MKTIVLYCLALSGLFFSARPLYGQDTAVYPLQLRLAPLNLFDPATPVLQVGVEKRVSPRIAFSLDYGLRTNWLLPYTRFPERKDYRYYKGKAEVKYFFKSRSYTFFPNGTRYLALQGFYMPQHYRKDSSWLITGGKSFQYDYSNIDRVALTASLLVGNEEDIRRRVLIDYYFGLGVRKLTIRHHAVGAVEAYRSEPKDWGRIDPADYYEDTRYRAHVVLGFKVGYILNP